MPAQQGRHSKAGTVRLAQQGRHSNAGAARRAFLAAGPGGFGRVGYLAGVMPLSCMIRAASGPDSVSRNARAASGWPLVLLAAAA